MKNTSDFDSVAHWGTDDRLCITSYSSWLADLFGTSFVGSELGDVLDSANVEHPIISAHLRALAGAANGFVHDLPASTWFVGVEPLKDAHGAIVGCTGRAERVDVPPEGRLVVAADLSAPAEAPRHAIAGVAALRVAAVLEGARTLACDDARLIIVATVPTGVPHALDELRRALSEPYYVDGVPHAVGVALDVVETPVTSVFVPPAAPAESGPTFVPRVRLSDGAVIALEARYSGMSFEGVFDALAAWAQRGLAVPRICLPVGLEHVRHPDFVQVFTTMMAWSETPAAALEIEIQEEAVVQMSSEDVGRLKELQKQGVGIILSAFGSAKLSLANVERLPLSAVKVSARLLSNPAATEAIAVAARLLRCRAIVEGVRSVSEAAAAAKAGFGEASGPLFVENVPPEEKDSVVINAGHPTFVL